MIFKRIALAAVVAAVFASAAVAGAPGAWTYLNSNSGFVSSGILDIGGLDDGSFVGVGIHQSSESGFAQAWKGYTDGTFYEVMAATLDLEDTCDVLRIFGFMTTVDFFTDTIGVAGGVTNEQCLAENPNAPECLACFIQLKGTIKRTTEAGEEDTFNVVDLPAEVVPNGSTIDAIHAVTDLFGVAQGYPNMLLATHDAGATWEKLPFAGGTPASVSFINEDIGFAATGFDNTPAKSGEIDPGEILARALWRTSAFYRATHPDFRRQKAIVGDAFFKTTDGGQTWETLSSGDKILAYKMSFANEQYGIVMAEGDSSALAHSIIYYTHDGGVTWEQASVPAKMPWDNGEYGISDVWMVDADLAYASVFVLKFGSLPVAGGFLISSDGGKTWQVDEYGSDEILGIGYMAMDGKRKSWAYAGGMGLTHGYYTGNANAAPTADAGDDGTGVVGETLNLDGSGSSDPDGDTLSYKWTQVSGPAIEMVSPFGVDAAFTPSAAGVVEFSLTVTDSEFWIEAPDTVSFTIDEPAPADDDDDAVDDDDDDDGGDDDEGDDDDDDAGADDDDDEDEDGGCCGC
ncbi:hypothetical protein K8I61_10005 [bacterium]|nr:hypothetical protein [bacterium]